MNGHISIAFGSEMQNRFFKSSTLSTFDVTEVLIIFGYEATTVAKIGPL